MADKNEEMQENPSARLFCFQAQRAADVHVTGVEALTHLKHAGQGS